MNRFLHFQLNGLYCTQVAAQDTDCILKPLVKLSIKVEHTASELQHGKYI